MTLFPKYKVHVPADLGEVATIAAAGAYAEHPGEDAGTPPENVEAIWRDVENLYRSRAYPAISFCLRRRGKILLNRSLGHARGNGPPDGPGTPKELLRPEVPVCLFSASKAITAILMHKLAEEGAVRLDQRVQDFIPEFARASKSRTTLADVLAHRGGFPTIALEKHERKVELLNDWDRIIELICASPPMRSPHMAYHAITGGFILAEVIQRVTGGSLRDYLDTRLRKPLGMKHFTYGLPRRLRARAALNYCAGAPVLFPLSRIVESVLLLPFEEVVDASNTDAFMDAVIPAGNLYATAEEASRFYQMLLNEGEYQGKQVLKPETVRRAVRPVGRMALDHSLMIPMRYSEGMMLGANPVGFYGPHSGRAYGHLGFMNVLAWADPEREISVALLVTGKALLGAHLLSLCKLLATICNRSVD